MDIQNIRVSGYEQASLDLHCPGDESVQQQCAQQSRSEFQMASNGVLAGGVVLTLLTLWLLWKQKWKWALGVGFVLPVVWFGWLVRLSAVMGAGHENHLLKRSCKEGVNYLLCVWGAEVTDAFFIVLMFVVYFVLFILFVLGHSLLKISKHSNPIRP